MNFAQAIKVIPPTISPPINSIGYGNPRYNSMLILNENALLTVGSILRLFNIKNNQILYQKQIGCSQIFQIMKNNKYIMTINFDGLISLLSFQFQIKYQFRAPGKQIRHSSINEKYISVSCQLLNGSQQSMLCVYSLQAIQDNKQGLVWFSKGHYYYPQFIQNTLIVLDYHDPNPKGRKRKETVLQQKLPITNRLVVFDEQFKQIRKIEVECQGQVICAAQSNQTLYYLHTSKYLTVFNFKTNQIIFKKLQTKSFPHLVQPYQDGIVYVDSSNKLTFVTFNTTNKQLLQKDIQIKTVAIGGNVSLKFTQKGIYSLNQEGLHLYTYQDKKTYTRSIFNITNCGIACDSKGEHVAVADFGGWLHIFSTEFSTMTIPPPIASVCVYLPIRTFAWCYQTNKIAIGCVGGAFYVWQVGANQAQFVQDFGHTINIIRAKGNKFYLGSSDGQVFIYDSVTLHIINSFKAHHPVHYQSQQQRQMFGSMKNHAQIWSITLSPHNNPTIVTCSEDQTERVLVAQSWQSKFRQIIELRGHELAVTSIDWKVMGSDLGEIYVSCSDDKIIRFRSPKDNFKVIFELQTTTIKQWHTLTYLCLQPQGTRVAVGSQNGYLFIYDIQKRQLQYGEKLHLGGIQGMQWKKGKLITCSSDLCLNVLHL